ncbi:MAG: hypothetical protein U9N76_04090 [Candidatus Marinimicrobia bacterium]|nr:hypothetical protein [Candidatus Neomarinimicrobiota bacterium]
MIKYDRIKKDCFWDYNFTNKEIKQLAESNNKVKRSFLFQKILLNSTSFLQDLKIFRIDVLHNLLKNYKVPEFNKEYIFRRKNMADVYFLDKKLLIDELKWML